MAQTLLHRTQRLLKDSPLTQREIACGARVGFEWLRKFAINFRDDYSLCRVQKLHDFLAHARPLNSVERHRVT